MNKRLTQRFPFLLPLRQWQRKKFFYIQMKFDANTYASTYSKTSLKYPITTQTTCMINKNSGQDIQYQFNKVENLKLVAKTINGLQIKPNETFSFFQCAKHVSNYGSYKEGLVLKDGELIAEKGGGLCQITNLLFQTFLHTPLTITERHPHLIENFPSPDADTPYGLDAAIAEGWQDLKVTNHTNATYMIHITFFEECMSIHITSNIPNTMQYELYNKNTHYKKEHGKTIQETQVWRKCTNLLTKTITEEMLYTNTCEIAYPIKEDK